MLFSATITQVAAALKFCFQTIIYNAVYYVSQYKNDKRNIQRALWEVKSEDIGKYVPPGPGDDRAPCPALNCLANHGYLPHSGRHITPSMLVHALQRAFNLSSPFAIVLTYGALLNFGQAGPISLADLARHNRVEHNGSLFHRDAAEGQMYAPKEIDEDMWKDLVESIERPLLGWGASDIAKLRVRREAESGDDTMTDNQKFFARGEAGAVVLIFGKDVQTASADGSTEVERLVPMDVLKTFLYEERLPEGWRPSKQAALLEVGKIISGIGKAMDEERKRRL